MLNIEKYENELRKYGTSFALTKEEKPVECDGFRCIDCAFNAGCTIKRMNWLLEEYKEPILNEDEKKILRGVIEAIKPFIKISPLITRYNEAYGQTLIVLSYENEHVRLPLFNRDKMFTNLEYEKQYTLEELGL